MTKSKSAPLRCIDDMLLLYAQLGREADDLLDLATAELRAEDPGCVSLGELKSRYFLAPAVEMLNVPQALRILRMRFE